MSADETPEPQTAREALAEVLAEHRLRDTDPACSCGWDWDCREVILPSEVDFDPARYRLAPDVRPAQHVRHVADAIIAAGWTPPDADQAAPSGADFIRRLLGAWDCCSTCAGGVLAQRDREREADQAATIADLRAEVARLQQQRKAALARAAKAEAERDVLRAKVERAREVERAIVAAASEPVEDFSATAWRQLLHVAGSELRAALGDGGER